MEVIIRHWVFLEFKFLFLTVLSVNFYHSADSSCPYQASSHPCRCNRFLNYHKKVLSFRVRHCLGGRGILVPYSYSTTELWAKTDELWGLRFSFNPAISWWDTLKQIGAPSYFDPLLSWFSINNGRFYFSKFYSFRLT